MSKEFRPAFEMPKTYEQALAVLEQWGQPTTFTFGHERAARIAKIMAYVRGVWIDEQVRKNDDIAALVNALTATAQTFGQTQQLRERIADVIVPHLKELADLRYQMEGLQK